MRNDEIYEAITDEDYGNFIHDEDSDHPNEIIDDEPENENQEVYDYVNATIDILESACVQNDGYAEVPMEYVKRAVQLLKAYSCLYDDLTMEDIEYDYD